MTAAGALKNYYRINNMLPDRIIVFRDGVGDGQLETVHEHEVRQLLECFKRVGEDYQYDVLSIISVVVVFSESCRESIQKIVTDSLMVDPCISQSSDCYCYRARN